MKKLLVIGFLMTTVILAGCSKTATTDDTAVVVPDNCISRFDGCNNCTVEDGKPMACTKMYCKTPTEAKCTQFANTDDKQDVQIETPVIPEGCTSWYDGCNNCTVKDGKADACTEMYCETPTTPKCTQFKE